MELGSNHPCKRMIIDDYIVLLRLQKMCNYTHLFPNTIRCVKLHTSF